MAGQMVIGVELEGFDELVKKLDPKLGATPVRKFLQRCGDDIQGKVTPLVPVGVTGQLKGSISKKVSNETPIPTYVEVGSNKHYAPYVEFGRPGGKQPPYDAIELWYRRKNSIPSDVDVFAEVREIQRRIGRFGTKEQPFLRTGLERAIPQMQKRVETLRTELEEAYKRGR